MCCLLVQAAGRQGGSVYDWSVFLAALVKQQTQLACVTFVCDCMLALAGMMSSLCMWMDGFLTCAMQHVNAVCPWLQFQHNFPALSHIRAPVPSCLARVLILQLQSADLWGAGGCQSQTAQATSAYIYRQVCKQSAHTHLHHSKKTSCH